MIWTSSFVLINGSFSILVFTLIKWLIHNLKLSQHFLPFYSIGIQSINLFLAAMDVTFVNESSFRQLSYQLFKTIAINQN